MTYRLSKTSLSRLKTCHPDIIRLVKYAIDHDDCPCDFTVVCGVRGRKDQQSAFDQGNSKAKFGKSPHNFTPSYAVDLAPYVPGVGIDWNDFELFDKLSDHVKSCAKELCISITWGGDFKSIVDKPHFELTYWRDEKKELAE